MSWSPLHETTITGQCSVDECWMGLINQPDDAARGLEWQWSRGERERKILEFNQEQHCSVIRPFRTFKDMKVLQRCANPHFLIIVISIIPIKSQNPGQENSQDLLRMLLCSIQVKPDFSGTRQWFISSPGIKYKSCMHGVLNKKHLTRFKHKKQQSKSLLVATQSTDNWPRNLFHYQEPLPIDLWCCLLLWQRCAVTCQSCKSASSIKGQLQDRKSCNGS